MRTSEHVEDLEQRLRKVEKEVAELKAGKTAKAEKTAPKAKQTTGK